MLSKIAGAAPDSLYAAAAAFAADTRLDKIDLTVGVYRDDDGRSAVMKAVKSAEALLLSEQTSKSYKPLMGDPDFLGGMTRLVLGADFPMANEGRIVAIQATGGTGALRLAAALAKAASPRTRLHLGTPTWPSHAGVFSSEGLEILQHRYWAAASVEPCWENIHAAALTSQAGDLFLLHGPCHNPTGIDLNDEQRATLLATLRHTGATPVLDVAYYGLAETLDEDLKVVRNAFAQSDRCIVALSCSKAFGLYRDRVGILLVGCASRDEAQRVSSRLGALSRLLVSGAPAHGAEVVARILADQHGTRVWQEELEEMRLRLAGLRGRLAQSAPDLLGAIANQRGIFAMLPLTSHQVQLLASNDGIYLAPSGRANLAGLRCGDVERFVDALCRVRASEG